ncbi:hypothetical protein POM88_039001 [Heracleum sosnowskyi]|uniref:Uncharacterized protein n=1 Tax=Heracleum sosnowskyi TaxID=360622 RepID=A0AAD8H9K9_9APIA|nr:hypothetical protein POM88_039001 [Heracleum sosnowskyi]
MEKSTKCSKKKKRLKKTTKKQSTGMSGIPNLFAPPTSSKENELKDPSNEGDNPAGIVPRDQQSIQKNKRRKNLKEQTIPSGAANSKKQRTIDDKKAMDDIITALSNDKTRLENDLDNKNTALKYAKSSNAALTKELNELKLDQANGWADEKKRIQDKSYEDGFRAFCRTFVAGDPSYNWASKFDKEIAAWIADFSEMEEEGIALKRAEVERILAAELARHDQDRTDSDGCLLRHDLPRE